MLKNWAGLEPSCYKPLAFISDPTKELCLQHSSSSWHSINPKSKKKLLGDWVRLPEGIGLSSVEARRIFKTSKSRLGQNILAPTSSGLENLASLLSLVRLMVLYSATASFSNESGDGQAFFADQTITGTTNWCKTALVLFKVGVLVPRLVSRLGSQKTTSVSSRELQSSPGMIAMGFSIELPLRTK